MITKKSKIREDIRKQVSDFGNQIEFTKNLISSRLPASKTILHTQNSLFSLQSTAHKKGQKESTKKLRPSGVPCGTQLLKVKRVYCLEHLDLLHASQESVLFLNVHRDKQATMLCTPFYFQHLSEINFISKNSI